MAIRIRSFFVITSFFFTNPTLVTSSTRSSSSSSHHNQHHPTTSTFLSSSSITSRELDISRSCQEELATLRESEQFHVKFPHLNETEFNDHCTFSETGITCDLDGTSLVDSYRTICEDDSGGKVVQMNITASGECVGVNITMNHFPLCAGKSCDEGRFIESYEAKLKTEAEFTGDDCFVDLTATASSSTRILIFGLPTTTVGITFLMAASMVILATI